ncbi:40055_t:CDS:2 [Gigaspora margarita]|uniref:40055_t:CDS:1 n=1 Tax=Gigaspora margarita TaxID=4874 RepID=A0ABM8W5S8_GIGMA|nr:40055_t:CDS:2 [Gigaspora margarita]
MAKQSGKLHTRHFPSNQYQRRQETQSYTLLASMKFGASIPKPNG